MIETFSIKSAQFEKNGSIGKFFIQLGNLKQNPLSKLEFDKVFRDLYTFAVR